MDNRAYNPNAPPQNVVVTQPVTTVVVQGSRPPDYLVPSIFACLCCFWPTGIVAIIYAMQVNSLYDQGDIAGANSASKMAKIFMIVSLTVGALAILVVIILAATGAFAYSATVKYY